jgi:hypothetical protein
MMEVPTGQEKSEQIFFAQPKAHQFKFVGLNKTVPTDPLKLIAFFEQCQATNKAAGVLKKIAKDKKQSKEKKQLILPLRIAVNQATGSIVAPQVLQLPSKQPTRLRRPTTRLLSSRLLTP